MYLGRLQNSQEIVTEAENSAIIRGDIQCQVLCSISKARNLLAMGKMDEFLKQLEEMEYSFRGHFNIFCKKIPFD